MGLLLHHAIAASADRAPDRDAFRCNGEGISYADLVTRAHRLANVLVAHGVAPHDRVGIYMSRGLETPVALYGILAAGAAYVPIDPTAPLARIKLIAEDCGIRHLVTNASHAQKATRLAATTPGLQAVIGCDPPESSVPGPACIPWPTVDEAPSDPPRVTLTDQDLAYIMYTSGSTGVPKGLMHTHASGGRYAQLSAREYDVRSSDRLGNHSPLHFDMSTFEFLTGPRCGATTIIIPEELTIFPMSLSELIEREQLTFWYSVPLALIQLLERGDLEHRDLGSLRWVLFGGEPFPAKHLARLVEIMPESRFSNSYGPAEVNQCTAYHVPQGKVDPDEPIPIGRVWSGADGLVVNEDDEPVTPGTAGELLIHSTTMMRGYWARPDLTERAFYRRSASPHPDTLYYRTGDLVRERSDGNLLFLGRKDRQVKIRGYRVELEEVESVLSSLSGVSEAGAIDVRTADGQVEIIAVVRLDQGATTDGDVLRRTAATRLPGYAVPTRIEIRQTLPRTGTGKIDRRALQAEATSAPH